MYLLDPRSGRRRRGMLRDKVGRLSHELTGGMAMATRDAGNRARGLKSRAGRALAGRERDDVILCERVRARLGHFTTHAHGLDVTAEQGIVTLLGPVLQEQHADVVRAAARTPGVHRVIDRLNAHPTPQAMLAHPAARVARPRSEWRPATRLLVGLASVTLLLRGLGRRRSSAWLAAGGLGLARSLSNLSAGRLIGRSPDWHGIEMQKTLYLRVPLEDAFRFFDKFQNFPFFMSHVKEVRALGDNHYLWKLTGPADITIALTSRVTERAPHTTIAWESTPDSALEAAGRMRFERFGDDGTRVTFRWVYCPPAGVAGHALAKILGADPKKQMDEDLLRVKSLLEQGKATGRAGTVRREDLTPS
jgi:uncharacterized membrane protein